MGILEKFPESNSTKVLTHWRIRLVKRIRRNLISIRDIANLVILSVGSISSTSLVYPILPSQIPTHMLLDAYRLGSSIVHISGNNN